MREVCIVVGGVFAFLAVFMLVVGCIAYSADRVSCGQLGSTTGYATRYPSIWTGCQVKVDGRWIPKDTWRVVDGVS